MAVLKPFLTAVVGAAISLQLLILANMSYLYGKAYRDGSRFSTMKMLFVDYDGGAVGQSVALAYDRMKGPGFPSLLQHSQEQYPTEQEIRKADCRASALSSSESAQAYDNSRALGYVHNSAKYPAYVQIVSSDLAQLAQATASVYAQTNLTAALKTINVTGPDIAQTVLDPISSTPTEIHPMNQGLFFIMAINGNSTQTNIFNTFSPGDNTILRSIISVCYTFIAALVMTGYIWAFRENWDVSSGHTVGPFELFPGFYRIGYAFPAHSLYELLLDIWTEGCDPHLYRTLPILWYE
ncbi:hypothetical protein BDW69DRAFT_204953 [Aspergillus filifer]